MRGLAKLLPLALLAAAPGCEDLSYRDIGSDIKLIATRDDALMARARTHLLSFGVAALPQIETALHMASPAGRERLLAAAAALGHPEAVPLFRHYAVYDTSKAVRTLCEDTLRGWTAGTDSRLAARASAALARVSEKRARGEAPVVIP